MTGQVDTLLGQGIYDLCELARLVGRSPDELTGWATSPRAGRTRRDALLIPRQGRLFSFYDLVTAVVTSEFRDRDVPLGKVRDARRFLSKRLEVEWPFAHVDGLKSLATVGRDIYFEDGTTWVDASKGGQAAFEAVVAPLIRRLEFDSEGMAAKWRPVEGVLLNPQIQAGAPCVDGTRLSTHFVLSLVEAGEAVEDVADDYDLPPEAVRRALAYEQTLAA